ncbi:MAG: hypothetical protein ABL986_03840 [Vicinamibacterales bacterium]
MSIVGALLILYSCGYVTGALFVGSEGQRQTLAVAMVRLIAGLMLSSVGFLLSLELRAPWYSVPTVLFVAAASIHRRAAFRPPSLQIRVTQDGVLAGLLALLALAPPLISTFRMAPGAFPPEFFNVDIPYFLEKVHALIGAQAYPPHSLSVVDGQRPYHFGMHGAAALISRGSGMLPHQVLFALVVPLLIAGIIAASVMLARAIAPALPLALTVPLLLVPVPTLWYDFWREVAPALVRAVSAGSLEPLEGLTRNWQIWAVTPNIQNLAGHFLVLASAAAIAAAPTLGWRLAVFLLGSAIIFKSPAGVALMAGFCLAQGWRVLSERSLRPALPAVAAVAVFGAVYGAFWILPSIPAELKTTIDPWFFLDYVEGHGGTRWFVYDIAWLVLPLIAAVPGWRQGFDRRNLAMLVFAIAPFLVVNVLRLVDQRRGFGVSMMNEDDWRQVMMPVPVLLHIFVISVLATCWLRLGRTTKSVAGVAVLLVTLPALFVSARYARVLLDNPAQGHEFADNRALGEALATIPTTGTLIVTNDLRYPADGFSRDERQMQIPALFGHQAFAVNYFYEAYPFSPERRELQKLLQAPSWSPAITEAARTHRWTHLLIRKDYVHPEPLPLERLFDSGVYSVYRF